MKKVLVANRGEIARRVFRSCRARGIATVAVHSDADAAAAHVAEADEAVAIGPAPARESYLRPDAVIAAAHASGADSIHPGYGFLAENAAFAQRVADSGLTWIGPSPQTITDMGDKQRAREIARRAGVPVVPGSARFSIEDEGWQEAAAEVGYPLLVKAAAGGGGIGMRRVDSPDTLAGMFAATRSMAAKAFGDATVYMERYVPRARHVELQVFGFGNGEAIHLFERDCSLQRRFQKVIEESPAPGLPADTRAAMAEAALRLARATRYAGAGTVEFILDVASGEFFFLEMNTRIQVEHPVTEMLTGRDLVGMQLDFAAGVFDAMPQESITASGHAVECRLYAEDPAKNFLPAPGLITRYEEPSDMEGIRVDSAYRQGDVVTSFYDPMIAKLIAHAPTREAAIDRAVEALRRFRVEGVTTNRDFLIACLKDAEFAEGRVHTGFIEARRALLLQALAPAAE
ncbi:acetyl-CoA carboxylase biotin carboxylase subunit [Ancylobacter defluvii]|uniref:Acetyl-CoA carboxylase biotin carboxylase subunit n=1 Tax=Ancylobacter defluvii TaxID=1282440 RepID=A0A9W6JV67_9HYPH|nr:biotin carboxylase N-terminal domain-containing protein [Ancylobacter defluvii]MBS7588482.1 ATP-grasp domain-containing protein [Ancylobacter defluvii]GLK83762.1 hypothetical protein GCM10017653_18320 [Ancylobacter defluvii]